MGSSRLRQGYGGISSCLSAILRVSSVRWLAEPKLTEGERRLAERVGFAPLPLLKTKNLRDFRFLTIR